MKASFSMEWVNKKLAPVFDNSTGGDLEYY